MKNIVTMLGRWLDEYPSMDVIGIITACTADPDLGPQFLHSIFVSKNIDLLLDRAVHSLPPFATLDPIFHYRHLYLRVIHWGMQVSLMVLVWRTFRISTRKTFSESSTESH